MLIARISMLANDKRDKINNFLDIFSIPIEKYVKFYT